MFPILDTNLWITYTLLSEHIRLLGIQSTYAYKIEKIRKKNHLEFNVKYKKRTHLLGFIAYFSLEDTDVNGGVMDNLFCFAQS